MNKAYLLTGSNEGDRHSHLKKVAEHLENAVGTIIQRSSIYETAPWGKPDQPNFLNQALLLSTSLDAVSMMGLILQIELIMGRKRMEKYGSRIVDIDILLFNHEVRDDPDLKIPHPELSNRRFALVPLDEISPSLKHPLLHKTIHVLLQECPDKLDVKKI